MTDAVSFVKLDVRTVKPYLTVKNLAVLFVLAAVFSFGGDTTAMTITMVMCFASVYATYPFVVGEKSNLNVLYSTLSIKRRTVVLGRYIFSAALSVFGAVLANVIAFIIFALQQKAYVLADSLLITGAMFFVFSFTQSIQLPLYFKLGYTKAKFAAYIPLVVLPAMIIFSSGLSKKIFTQSQLENFIALAVGHPLAVAAIVFLAWVIIINISYRVSKRFYMKQDF